MSAHGTSPGGGASARLVTPLEAWPPIDRALWERGAAPGDQLDDPKHADSLRPKTIANARKGYGRLLAVLARRGPLDPDIGPAERVTRAAMSEFVAVLRATNTSNTVKQRLFQVRIALKIMCPAVDTSWIVRPRGRSLDQWFPAAPPRRVPHDANALREWGFSLMEQVGHGASPRRALVACRDGLIIALLASGAPRLSTLAGMRLGVHLMPEGGTYRVTFRPADLKVPEWQSYLLAPRLAAAMRHYLEVVRPALLQGERHDGLFVGESGDQLKATGTEAMVRRRTRMRDGEASGPHRFRDALASAIARRLPNGVEVAAAMLANSPAVAEKHYIRAQEERAAQVVTQSMVEDREATRALAEEMFAKMR